MPPANGFTDEVRCFTVELGNPQNQWVTAVNWVYGQTAAVHHVGAMVVDETNAAVARALEGKDGRPGYECAASFGDGVSGSNALAPSEAGYETGTTASTRSTRCRRRVSWPSTGSST